MVQAKVLTEIRDCCFKRASALCPPGHLTVWPLSPHLERRRLSQWLLCLAWWMTGPWRKQTPKVWQWLLLAFWSHRSWLSIPQPSDLWCPWAGAACARWLPQPRDGSQALILLEAGDILPACQEPSLHQSRKNAPWRPLTPALGFLTRTLQLQAQWLCGQLRLVQRQTSLPDPASQTTDSKKKAFAISIFLQTHACLLLHLRTSRRESFL